ncbi:hypothetical protein BBP40_000908, partial [Aspergillus hancockii]
GPIIPTLNAWHRLAIADLVPDSRDNGHYNTEHEPNDLTKGSFSPAFYSQQAYTLINTLLATYQPTHILIERQRFRTGGGSAVQEWTLKVGVFEGMLYAVLYALKQERSGAGSAPVVLGVEPQRVARFWSESGADRVGGKVKTSAKEGKRVKIDLVGGWLDLAVAVRDGVVPVGDG